MRTIDIERDEVAAVNGPDEEARRIRRQRLRSTAIAFGLAFLVLLFYAATIVRMGGQPTAVGGFGPGAQSGETTRGAEPQGGSP
jgi:hypothetical protein